MTITIDENIYSRIGEFTLTKSPSKRQHFKRMHRRFQSMPVLQDDTPNSTSKHSKDSIASDYEKTKALYKKCQSRLRISPSLFSSLVSLFLLVGNVFTLKKAGLDAFSVSSFSQLVYISTTLYYFLFLFCTNFARSQLKYLVIYFTFAINGAHWLVFWLVPTANQPDNLIARNAELGLFTPAFLALGTKVTMYYPIISWWVFQLVNRNILTLLIWEFEILLPSQFFMRLYRIFSLFSPIIFPIAWRFVLGAKIPLTVGSTSFSLIVTDLDSTPSFLSTLLYSFGTGCVYFCWISFLTFQYRGVVWKIPSAKGFLVFQDEEKSSLCELY